jgi:hypothetical protein
MAYVGAIAGGVIVELADDVVDAGAVEVVEVDEDELPSVQL